MKNKHIKSFEELNENKNLNISDVSDSKKSISNILDLLDKKSILKVNVKNRGFINSFNDIDVVVINCRMLDIEDINHFMDMSIKKYQDKIVIFDDYKKCKYENEIINLSNILIDKVNSKIILTNNITNGDLEITEVDY